MTPITLKEFDSLESRDHANSALLAACEAALELASWHFDPEADESSGSPEDMTAHVNGLIVKRMQAAIAAAKGEATNG